MILYSQSRQNCRKEAPRTKKEKTASQNTAGNDLVVGSRCLSVVDVSVQNRV